LLFQRPRQRGGRVRVDAPLPLVGGDGLDRPKLREDGGGGFRSVSLPRPPARETGIVTVRLLTMIVSAPSPPSTANRPRPASLWYAVTPLLVTTR
jgi:hypothetical protein